MMQVNKKKCILIFLLQLFIASDAMSISEYNQQRWGKLIESYFGIDKNEGKYFYLS